jgi:hypothetical protein
LGTCYKPGSYFGLRGITWNLLAYMRPDQLQFKCEVMIYGSLNPSVALIDNGNDKEDLHNARVTVLIDLLEHN